MADAWTTPGEPGATRYLCPLCDEFFVDEDPADAAALGRDQLYRLGVLTYNDGHDLERLARVMDVEGALRDHCASHPLEQWVAATARLSLLRGAVAYLADIPAPSPERLADLVLEGSLTISEARWFRLALGAIEALDVVAAEGPGAPAIPGKVENGDE